MICNWFTVIISISISIRVLASNFQTKSFIVSKMRIITNLLLLQVFWIALITAASLDKSCVLKYDPKTSFDAFAVQERKEKALEQASVIQKIEVPNGKTYRLQCLDDLSVFRNLESITLDLQCKGGILFSTETHEIFQDDLLACGRAPFKPKSELIENGTCYHNASNIDVVFKTTDPAYALYSVCFDKRTSTTLFSQSYIDGKALAAGELESGTKRPSFKDTGFFTFEVNLAYKQDNEFETFAHLLGSEEMATKYLPSRNYYLSRGHLFPNGDPIKKYEKDATFYYINVVPQWQILNNGNWKNIEMSVRELAKSLESKVKVWTGSYGVLKLEDVNNNPVELWLHNEENEENDPSANEIPTKKLPVPKFLWKVVYDEVEQAALAVVQINNPHAKNLTKEDLLCEDICNADQIPWLKFKKQDLRKGYTYCCDVNSLKKVIEYVPTLNYTKVLDYHERFTEHENVTEEGEDGDELDENNDSFSSSSEEDSDEYIH